MQEENAEKQPYRRFYIIKKFFREINENPFCTVWKSGLVKRIFHVFGEKTGEIFGFSIKLLLTEFKDCVKV